MNISKISTYHNTVRFIISLWLLIILGGCSQHTAKISVLSNPTCQPPCWQNIEPGKSTVSEVVKLLQSNAMIDSKSITIRGESWKIFNDIVYFLSNSNKVKGEIYFLDGNVAMILLAGEVNVSFGQAIDTFGDPEYIINIPMIMGPPGIPTTSYEIIALKPKMGVEFGYDTRDISRANRSEVKPKNELSLISFFDPNVYDNLLEVKMFSEGFFNRDKTIKYMRVWNGYGVIEQKYPPADLNDLK